jgi:hypothetical protein
VLEERKDLAGLGERYQQRFESFVGAAQAALVPLRTISGPAPALTNTASRSSARPRNSEVTGMSRAAASRARVARLGEVWAFSILESMPLEISLRSASWLTDRPISWRRDRT